MISFGNFLYILANGWASSRQREFHPKGLLKNKLGSPKAGFNGYGYGKLQISKLIISWLARYSLLEYFVKEADCCNLL